LVGLPWKGKAFSRAERARPKDVGFSPEGAFPPQNTRPSEKPYYLRAIFLNDRAIPSVGVIPLQ